MSRERLYIVHGMGNDAVGLVGSITAKVAEAGGNIVDLRQDVLHGLFTIYMVVDLGGSSMRIDSLKKVLDAVSEDTGIKLEAEKYLPVARNPGIKNMLLILVGNDRPGIIASISQTLARYNVNIEFASTVARENVFLMELMTDISSSSLPVENLASTLAATMKDMGMQTIVQTSDVFNKKKRVILFDISAGVLNAHSVSEIMSQAKLNQEVIGSKYPETSANSMAIRAGSLLDGIPVDVLSLIATKVSMTPQTAELLQTLKTMGYSIGLVSGAFSFLTDSLRERFGLDYCFGPKLLIDDDTRTVTGAEPSPCIADAIGSISASEHIESTAITTLDDKGCEFAPGIRLEIKIDAILDLYNKKLLTANNLVGLLGCFGHIRGKQAETRTYP